MSTILLVEDNTALRTALSIELEHAGYAVTQAADGETAIRLLQPDRFQVVLTDIVMNQVSGIDVMYAALQVSPNPPKVILLTGHATTQTAIQALRAGAQDYIQKPFEETQLLDSVRRAAQCHRQEAQLRASMLAYLEAPVTGDTGTHDQHDAESVLVVGSISIGPNRQEVFVGQDRITITPTEYQLLRFLAHHAGTTCSYRAITWETHRLNMDDDEARALLWSHASNLRKKLPADTLLVNDRGSGYRIQKPETKLENVQE